MHRRQFGLLSLGTAAATAGVPVMLAPARAQDTVLPRSIAQLPADLRSLMAQSFAKFLKLNTRAGSVCSGKLWKRPRSITSSW
jgi:hypothetical protein